MSKSKGNLPSPAKRPDLYDSYDPRPGEPILSQSYKDAVRPDYVKQAMATRAKAPAGK